MCFSVPESLSQQRLILLVEDDENDVLLLHRAFERAGLKNPIQRVATGAACLAYLSGEPPYEDRGKFPLPALVLLDIKMPGLDGFEVLRWIRHHPSFQELCVVMLTAAEEISQVTMAYQLGADSFLVKPLDFWNAKELVKSLDRLLAKC